MAQKVYDVLDGSTLSIALPDYGEEVIPGVFWGYSYAPFTPAYWFAQTWYANNRSQDAYFDYRRTRSLRLEIVACLLGGYGIASEVNEAAFGRLQERGLLDSHECSTTNIYAALDEPLNIEGKFRRYRFPKQKALFVHRALQRFKCEEVPAGELEMRQWLLSFSGIGPKTASWITRNWLNSNQVAIIDIHVFRAGVIAGLFSVFEGVERHYFQLEERFLRFAKALGVEPRRLDVLIWRSMKDAGAYGLECFSRHNRQPKNRN